LTQCRINEYTGQLLSVRPNALAQLHCCYFA